jgi:hypothetical protein
MPDKLTLYFGSTEARDEFKRKARAVGQHLIAQGVDVSSHLGGVSVSATLRAMVEQVYNDLPDDS